MSFYIIAAVDEKMGIGKNGKLPWHLPSDLKFFHNTTVGRGKNAVIMGRITWESIPESRRPLKDRLNIVITRNPNYELPADAEKAASLEEALKIAHTKNIHEIFAIGGSQIFYDAIQNPACEKIYLTELAGDFQCDAFFPKIDPKKFKKTSESPVREENGIKFRFVKYQ